jgi:hypothetical protein
LNAHQGRKTSHTNLNNKPSEQCTEYSKIKSQEKDKNMDKTINEKQMMLLLTLLSVGMALPEANQITSLLGSQIRL